MSTNDPTRLRYLLAVERAQGEARDRDLARLRAEVARLQVAVGERPAPKPIVVPAAPAPVSRMAPPEPEPKPTPTKPLKRATRGSGGWLAHYLREHGPATVKQIVEATGRGERAVRRVIGLRAHELVSERSGNHTEMRWSLRIAAAG